MHSTARRVQACSNCREVGHNKKTCPQRAGHGAAAPAPAVHVAPGPAAGSNSAAAGLDSAPRFRPPPIQPTQPPPVVAPGVFACTLHVRVRTRAPCVYLWSTGLGLQLGAPHADLVMIRAPNPVAPRRNPLHLSICRQCGALGHVDSSSPLCDIGLQLQGIAPLRLALDSPEVHIGAAAIQVKLLTSSTTCAPMPGLHAMDAYVCRETEMPPKSLHVHHDHSLSTTMTLHHDVSLSTTMRS